MRSAAWAVLLVSAGFIGCTAALAPPHGPLGSPLEMAMEGPADNSYCYVCHVNFKKESLAQSHGKASVGCAKCHGWSDDHSADEDGLTPPEIMYPQDRINLSCLKCHNGFMTVDVAAMDGALKASPANRDCCDCHGAHRVTVRTRRWDKATGELTYDDGVRMIGGASMKLE